MKHVIVNSSDLGSNWTAEHHIERQNTVTDIDPTEDIRRAMIPQTPKLVQQELEAGRPVWDYSAVRDVFQITGFLAPFVTAVRKSDGVKGTLMFTDSPRFYFAWVPDEVAK